MGLVLIPVIFILLGIGLALSIASFMICITLMDKLIDKVSK